MYYDVHGNKISKSQWKKITPRSRTGRKSSVPG